MDGRGTLGGLDHDLDHDRTVFANRRNLPHCERDCSGGDGGGGLLV
jgi:hypothetical protein